MDNPEKLATFGCTRHRTKTSETKHTPLYATKHK